jgi:hypothetical protein
LEEDESCNAVTYVCRDREVTIWESSQYDCPEQEEEDDVARNRIIWERLNATEDWFFCHLDGSRIEAGEAIEHHSRILIGHRDEIDPDWWHRPMREMKKREDIEFTPPADCLEDEEEETVPEPAQPALCLPSSRLDQHKGEAHVDGGMETSKEESNVRGKPEDVNTLEDCTAAVDLKSQLLTLKESVPKTLQAIISFERHSVQMFFSPENAIADFKRKVKDLWNIPEKMYYLLINGVHELITPKSWPKCSPIQVMIKGLLGGGKAGALTIFIEGEECRCKINQTLLEILEDRDMEI